MNYERIVATFIKIMRGNRTQNELSRILGYNYNIVNRWEKGTKKILWNDIVVLCQSNGIALDKVLFELCGFRGLRRLNGPHIVQLLVENDSSKKIAREHFSNQKIRRLMAGESQLSFEDFLRIVEIVFSRSRRFFDLVLERENFIKLFGDNYLEYNDLVGKNPALAMVRMVVDLKGYKTLPEHSSEYLANRTGLSVLEINSMLAVLENIGMIRWENKRFVTNADFVDTRLGDKEGSRKILNYWRAETLRHSNSSTKSDLSKLMSAYLFYGTNDEIDKAIFSLCNKFYIDFKNIITQHENDEFTSLKFMNIDLFCPLR